MLNFILQNNTAEVNQTGDGFFPSIFNEDDLQLMDMAITDSNFTYKIRKYWKELLMNEFIYF